MSQKIQAASTETAVSLRVLLKAVNHFQIIARYRTKLQNGLKQTFINYVFPRSPDAEGNVVDRKQRALSIVKFQIVSISPIIILRFEYSTLCVWASMDLFFLPSTHHFFSTLCVLVFLLVFSVVTLQVCEPGHYSHSLQRLKYFTRLLRFPVAQEQSEFALCTREVVQICASMASTGGKEIFPPPIFSPLFSRNLQHKCLFAPDLSTPVLCSASRPTSLTGMWSPTSMRSIPATSASSPSECHSGLALRIQRYTYKG